MLRYICSSIDTFFSLEHQTLTGSYEVVLLNLVLREFADKLPYLYSFPSSLPFTNAKMCVKGSRICLRRDLENIFLQYLKCLTKSYSHGSQF